MTKYIIQPTDTTNTIEKIHIAYIKTNKQSNHVTPKSCVL